MLWDEIDRRALAGSVGRQPEGAPVVYGRVCDVCGHYELSEDPLLVIGRRECPSCTVRAPRHAERP